MSKLANVVVAGVIGLAAYTIHRQMPKIRDAILFDPAPTTKRSIAPEGRVVEGFLEGRLHFRHYFQRSETVLQRSCIVFYHGRRGSIETHDKFLWQLLCKCPDYDILAVDYSGFGKSSGTPSEDGILKDGQLAFQYAQNNYQFLVAFGYSLGGAVACKVAQKYGSQPWTEKERKEDNPLEYKSKQGKLIALVLMSTFSSIREIMESFKVSKGLPKLARILASYSTNLPIKTWLVDVRVPVFICHSKSDKVIGFDHCGRNYDAASSSPLRQFYLLKKGHGDIEDQVRQGMCKALNEFLFEAENMYFDLQEQGYPQLMCTMWTMDSQKKDSKEKKR